MKKLITCVLVLFAVSLSVAQAHSGRTDSNGCHMDTKTGTRHCH